MVVFCDVMAVKRNKKALCYIQTMFADSDILTEGPVHPRSFGGLMALYESNYIKLLNLLGDYSACSSHSVSRSASDFPLHLRTETVSRYTRELRLTYLLGDGRLRADPDLRLKIYLDARMAEVCSWAHHHHHGLLLNLRRRYGRELDRRWSRNMMLSKWLDYLIDKGHGFSMQAMNAGEAVS